MDPLAIIPRLCAVAGRGPGTDAERRAALLLRSELRARGRRALLDVHWTRPHWAGSLALHGLLGVAAGVASVYAPLPGLVAALVLAVSLALETTGRGRLLGLLWTRRATQHAWSPPRSAGAPVTLVVAASYAAPRQGWIFADARRRLGARVQTLLGHRAPGARAWPVLALLLVALAAALRAAGVETTPVAVLQLLPTLLLLFTTALAVDAALSPWSPGAGAGSAVAAALAVADALEARPPRALAVSVLLTGGGPAALRAHLRRHGYRPDTTVVLEVLPCARGEARWVRRHGALLARRPHRQLVAAADAARRGQPHVLRDTTLATAARPLPAIAVGAFAPPGYAAGVGQASDVADAVDPAAVRATGRLAIALVRALDAELDQRLGVAEAENRAASSPTPVPS